MALLCDLCDLRGRPCRALLFRTAPGRPSGVMRTSRLRALSLLALVPALSACSVALAGGGAERERPRPAPASRTAARPDLTPELSEALRALEARRLMVPVAGVAVGRVPDSFNEPRSGGRVHQAVDILAPRGTPVLAADDGRVLRLRSNAA